MPPLGVFQCVLMYANVCGGGMGSPMCVFTVSMSGTGRTVIKIILVDNHPLPHQAGLAPEAP